MSMKWKLRKDKIQAETPASDLQAPPDTPAASESPVFDLSGAAFAPVGQLRQTEETSALSVEDEPAADGEGTPHDDSASVIETDPRFQVDEEVLSFLTEDAPTTMPLSPEQDYLSPEQEYAAETAHAEAGPQGIDLPAESVPPSEEATEFARLDAHASDPLSFTDTTPVFEPAVEPMFEPVGKDVELPAFDAADTVLDTEAASAFSLDAPLFDLQREAIAPGLVSSDDGGLPRVAPFVLDVPAPATPIGDADTSHRLVLRLGNLSATYELNKAVITIGRPDSVTQNYPDIEIELDDGVSRRHAEVRRDTARFYVVDVGSTNGTILNGEMLAPQQPALLAHGDRIRVGERTEIIFE